MAQTSPSMQAGIFGNDLCISFRIVLQEVLDNFVYKILADAKELSKKDPGSTQIMFERGVRSVNSWDTQLKERYRAQVVAQYRQIAQLYRHLFLMYVEEMYHESLGDITVRVSIPSLSNMLYTFVKLACNNPAVYTGEYVATMPYMGRILFVETTIRRTLYELLVQQNNIKGITTSKPAANPDVSSPMSSPLTRNSRPPSRVAVVEEDHVVSHELAMGHNEPPKPQKPQKLNMQALSEKLSRISNGSDSTNSVSSTSKPRTPSVAMPSMHSSTLEQPAFNDQSKASFKFFDTAPTDTSTTSKPQLLIVKSPHASPPPVVSPAPPPTAPSAASSVQPAASTASIAAPSLGAVSASAASLVISEAKTAAEPSNAGQTIKDTATTEPIFEIASQFTAHKPAGQSLPMPDVSRLAEQNDGQLDSLQLLPSDQDFGGEVRRLLDSNTNTNSITPFDSVTNIGSAAKPPQGQVRKSLFLPPHRT